MTTETRSVNLFDRRFEVSDRAFSKAVDIIVSELKRDAYSLRDVNLAPGEIVIDIGGHVGLFALFAASRWPNVEVHSFEPLPANIFHFAQNVERSGLSNIHLHQYAISANGLPVTLYMREDNTGAASSFSHRGGGSQSKVQVPSMTLDDALFTVAGERRCALLKLDCEGAEHEVVATTKALTKIDRIRGEIHVSQQLSAAGLTAQNLVRRCLGVLPKENLRFTICDLDIDRSSQPSRTV